MTSSYIASRIKAGLAKAINKTGSSSSDLVYLVTETKAGGTLTTPPSIVESEVLLKNAIFKDYDAKVFDVNILAGDRALVCDNSVVIKQGDTIKQGSSSYIVVNPNIKAPTSDVLAYVVQVRLK